jgi:flavorubredoxin
MATWETRIAGSTACEPSLRSRMIAFACSTLGYRKRCNSCPEREVIHDTSKLFFSGTAVSKLINLSELRHISFSHFESDECGSLNEWLAVAPKADVICSQVGALVNVNDFIGRDSHAVTDGGTFATGKYRFRYCQTPHLPHGRDAGVLFEETQRTLLCSDLFHQIGDVEPLTSADVVGRGFFALIH